MQLYVAPAVYEVYKAGRDAVRRSFESPKVTPRRVELPSLATMVLRQMVDPTRRPLAAYGPACLAESVLSTIIDTSGGSARGGAVYGGAVNAD